MVLINSDCGATRLSNHQNGPDRLGLCSVDPELLQTILVSINLLIPIMGVGMAIGGIAWEYRKYYEAKIRLLHGVGSAGGGLGFGLVKGLANKTMGRMGDLFGKSVDISTSQVRHALQLQSPWRTPTAAVC